MKALALALLLAVMGFVPASSGHLLYDDEFHGNTFHAASYNLCYAWGCAEWWNNGQEQYVPGNVSVQNGKLDLHASVATGATYPYNSGMITTDGKFSFLYGAIDVRTQLPHGQGLWPALWLLAQDGSKYREVDIFEVLGNDTTVAYQGVHYPNAAGHHKHDGGPVTVADLSQGYHDFQLDWRADHLSYFIDGHLTRSITNTAEIPHMAMYLIANLAVGGTWPGKPDATTHFPADYLIDYIRVAP